mmetsp:Transcript_8394/g.7946  ORF Transcript_8394/g.7946 Transcript_8394/m.7946 type:complete len:268 (-) Transcript_8394:255-1058(-)|eukprot:CAMPEP_0197829102 /NCGR_PEP_ID=MMETSP1437-20131217/5567_1 /TAXON_ID=49252 ORGANISM="Eucampia antarctica, Strain CCMP1452" /NCGR_SAMPLE_ID=MMETSP1437 /ASSEMBLY_ACC=CAM_ASM_001096 /LENGTH=267 /DNA_ID=CAMNT_0043430599 /DNA_START=115 /DNA_END=918 /DNA_ORIENTATION=+
MSAVKSKSHQKKKPTRQAKRKRAVVGDDDVHLINDPTHQESILIAGENDAGNILTLVSPERGTIARLEPLFDDASVSPSISPLVISDVQAPNKRFTKFKDAVTRKSSPTLDDKCVLTQLRSSFVQTSMGELKAGARKPINVRHVRRFAMHNFAASSSSKKKHINPSGNLRSTRHNLTSTSSVTECTLDMDISSMYSAFDLSSRNIRRYIIEDIMYMSVGDLVTILIDSKSVGSENWEDIANKEQFNLEVVMIGEVSYFHEFENPMEF